MTKDKYNARRCSPDAEISNFECEATVSVNVGGQQHDHSERTMSKARTLLAQGKIWRRRCRMGREDGEWISMHERRASRAYALLARVNTLHRRWKISRKHVKPTSVNKMMNQYKEDG